jgi:acetyl-CoA synthetase
MDVYTTVAIRLVMDTLVDFQERDWASLSELQSAFEWDIPETVNATRFLCDRWVDDGSRQAVIYEDQTANRRGTLTFEDLAVHSADLADYMHSTGVETGNFVAINMSQKPETLIAHLAVWRLGAISIPLSVLFGPEGLSQRISQTRPPLGIIDSANFDSFQTACDRIGFSPDQLVVNRNSGGNKGFWEAIEAGEGAVETAATNSDDPLLLMYTSGTTGQPKGVLQPHRCILGHIPGAVATFYNLDVRGDERCWTPAEWAWGAGLTLIIDALYFGGTVVCTERGDDFDPTWCIATLRQYDTTHAFLPPTALRMLKESPVANRVERFPNVRVITSGGESLDADTHRWAEQYFDATVHEGYGSSEMFDHIIGGCSALEPAVYDGIGYSLPGHRVRVLDTETNDTVSPGEIGEIVLHRDDPTLFTGYLGQSKKTTDSFTGDWFRTGDLATKDENGQFTFVGRKDDLIISAGYRIGPDEIEASLTAH